MKAPYVLLVVAGLVIASRAALAEPSSSEESPGVSLGIGAGVTAFYDTDMTRSIDMGTTWDARAVIGTRSRVALELAYVGSLQDIDVSAMGDAALLGIGFEADVRLNIVPDVATPFLVIGAGWTRYELVDAPDVPTMTDRDHVVTLPVGLGLDYRVGTYVIDGRGVLRPTFDSDFVPSGRGAAQLDSWTLMLHGAREF